MLARANGEAINEWPEAGASERIVDLFGRKQSVLTLVRDKRSTLPLFDSEILQEKPGEPRRISVSLPLPPVQPMYRRRRAGGELLEVVNYGYDSSTCGDSVSR